MNKNYKCAKNWHNDPIKNENVLDRHFVHFPFRVWIFVKFWPVWSKTKLTKIVYFLFSHQKRRESNCSGLCKLFVCNQNRFYYFFFNSVVTLCEDFTKLFILDWKNFSSVSTTKNFPLIFIIRFNTKPDNGVKAMEH